MTDKKIAPRIFAMDLLGEMVGQMQVGHFCISSSDNTKLLRRPISISEINRKRKICRIIYRIEQVQNSSLGFGKGFQLRRHGAHQKRFLIYLV